MSSRPTHVLVVCPVDCTTCGNTGEVKSGFVVSHRPDGSSFFPCMACMGAKTEQRAITQRAITLEEFAKLFTYGQTMTTRDGKTVEMTNDIRVKEEG